MVRAGHGEADSISRRTRGTGGGLAARLRSRLRWLIARCRGGRTLLIRRLRRASQREPVAVRVGEIGVPAPVGIDDRLLLDELDPKRFQAFELAVQVARVDDAGPWNRTSGRIGLARRPRPED